MAQSEIQRTLESIGANVARLRGRAGLTQAELAENADLDLRFVQRVERATTNLGVGALVSLAGALGVEARVLLRAAVLRPVKRGRPPSTRARSR